MTLISSYSCIFVEVFTRVKLKIAKPMCLFGRSQELHIFFIYLYVFKWKHAGMRSHDSLGFM
jgi:hypothetical protein